MKKRVFSKNLDVLGIKGQTTVAVAVLIIVMLVFIIIYILSLPPESREKLLNLTTSAVMFLPFFLSRKK